MSAGGNPQAGWIVVSPWAIALWAVVLGGWCAAQQSMWPLRVASSQKCIPLPPVEETVPPPVFAPQPSYVVPAGAFVPVVVGSGAAPGQEDLGTGAPLPAVGQTASTSQEVQNQTVRFPNRWLEHLQRLDISGHVRIRHEIDTRRLVGPPRNRQRLRARLAFTYRWNEEVRAGIRWTTGDRKIVLEPDDRAGSPLSYQDAGDVLDKFEFNLDRIFITLTPSWFPGGWITLGKFRNPVRLNPIFAAPVGDLVWDEAAHPEGVAAGWEGPWPGLDRLEFLLGESWVLELANQDEASLFFTQLWAQKRWGRWTVEASLAWYDWNNLNPDGNTRISAENNVGNAVVQVGPDPNDVVFVSGFSVLNPMLVLTWDPPSGVGPWQVVWEYFYNTQSFDAQRASGFSIGMQLGPAVRSQKQGAWKVYYTWNEVEQESVFTPVVQDDFQLASNFRGHWVGLDWFLWDQVELRLWVLSSKPILPIPGLPRHMQWRFRIDLTTYF